MEVKITDYTTTPGGRFKENSTFSGEEFREKYLEPNLSEEEIIVYLDGVEYGYPTSFLEEAFGGLARKVGKDNVLSKIKFVSSDKMTVDEILSYIERAEK